MSSATTATTTPTQSKKQQKIGKKQAKQKNPEAKPEHTKLKKTAWFVGHCVILVTSAIEILSYLTLQQHRFISRLIYRIVFLTAVATYSLSLSHSLGVKSGKREIPVFAVLHLPTFQYGALAALWVISRHHLLKLTPYFVYSLLQVADHTAHKLHYETETIDYYLDKYASKLQRFVANCNVLLFVRLLLDVLMIRRGSGVSMIVYIFYFRLTMDNPETASALKNMESHLDTFFNQSFIPAKVNQVWSRVKWQVDHRETYALTPEQKEREEEIKRQQKQKDLQEEKENEQKLPAKKEDFVDADNDGIDDRLQYSQDRATSEAKQALENEDQDKTESKGDKTSSSKDYKE